MTIEHWLAFVAASAVLLILPGPTVLTVISYSLAQGRRARGPLIAAVALGDATALSLSTLGLGALLATSSFWFTTLKWVGGLYLLFLGIRMLRTGVAAADLPAADFASPDFHALAAPGSRWRLFANTALVTALNPKSIAFFVAFLPQFISPEAAHARQLWILAVTFVILASINAALYAVFASSARRLLSSSKALRRFNCAGGSLLTTAGVWALLAERPA